MERVPDHPDIRAAERTGYPVRRANVFTTCDWCGCTIWTGSKYYEIHGEILCEKCIEDCEREAFIE